MKIDDVRIRVTEVNEGGRPSLQSHVAGIDLEAPDERFGGTDSCDFHLDFFDDGDVRVTVKTSLGKAMPLDKQWKNAISVAKTRLKEAAESLPSDDISEHIDLGRGGARST